MLERVNGIEPSSDPWQGPILTVVLHPRLQYLMVNSSIRSFDLLVNHAANHTLDVFFYIC